MPLETLPHAGLLADCTHRPGSLDPEHRTDVPIEFMRSCCFCGIGDSHLCVEGDEPPTMVPTTGCIKLRQARMSEPGPFPIHLTPSVLEDGHRTALSYPAAIERFADLLLAHRPPQGRTLTYACGQIDYFTVFAMQEVFRLLGVRNIGGNAEHCLNSEAKHQELQTGQEGPYLTVGQCLETQNSFFLFNGWNGRITHPPVFRAITRNEAFDGYIIDVMQTESADAVAEHLGSDRVLYVRSGSDPHLALAVANEVLRNHSSALEPRFVEHFADRDTLEAWVRLASSERFSAAAVAERISPEPELIPKLTSGIQGIAAKLADPNLTPFQISSMGLAQTSGVVALCLWSNLFAALGKYGLRPDGRPRGGTLRLTGQVNAASESQGVSRNYFMGRIPLADAEEAAARMGLPNHAYARLSLDAPRAVLDYADHTGTPELMVFLGTQFSTTMMGRKRWMEKLRAAGTRIVVIDPIPDPFALEHADLIIPSPPHPATGKVYQNGEWKICLSLPTKEPAPGQRSDPTVLYDVMAAISNRIAEDPAVATAHPDLHVHSESGYLRARFCSEEDGGSLPRIDGEVSRPVLWERVISYLSGGYGPLYCLPTHPDGTAISWTDLLERGSLWYGGVGTSRYVLDYSKPGTAPFRDVYGIPRQFSFFVPNRDDLEVPEGVLLNSGRACLRDDRDAIHYATSSFNSGKSTPTLGMPDINPLHVSPGLARRRGLTDGGEVRLMHANGGSIILPVVVNARVKGDTCYSSFHKSRAELERGLFLNDVTGSEDRCRYSQQTRLKATRIRLEPVN